MNPKLFILLLAALAQSVFSQDLDSVATPEPSTVALFSIGLAGIGFAAWRRKRKK